MKYGRVLFLAFSFALLGNPAWADSVQLGAGGPGINNAVAVSGSTDLGFSFDYDSTRVVARNFVALSINPACPCALGSLVDLDNHLVGSMTGLAVVNGVAYTGVNYLFDFTFDAAGLATVVPPHSGLESGPNFTFTGTLSGTLNGQPLVPLVTLTGAGTTQFSPNPVLDDPTNMPVRLLYSFTDQTSPTPEPASLLLVASGVGILARKPRRSGSDC